MSQIPFRPYKAELIEEGQAIEIDVPLKQDLWDGRQLVVRERMLKEELRDRYLKEAIEWLLNFQDSGRPIRAQEAESPWEAAQSVTFFLDAREIFVAEGVHPELVGEIDRKVPQVARWLVEKAQVDGAGMSWEDRLFDTGIIVYTLLRVRAAYRSNLEQGLACDLVDATRHGVTWLCEKLADPGSAKDYSSKTRLTLALLTADQDFHREFRSILKRCKEKLGMDAFLFLGNELLSKTRDALAKKKTPGPKIVETRHGLG